MYVDIHNIHSYYWIVRRSTGAKSAIGVLRYTSDMSFNSHRQAQCMMYFSSHLLSIPCSPSMLCHICFKINEPQFYCFTYSVHNKYGNSKLSCWYPKFVAFFMTYLISSYGQYCKLSTCHISYVSMRGLLSRTWYDDHKKWWSTARLWCRLV